EPPVGGAVAVVVEAVAAHLRARADLGSGVVAVAVGDGQPVPVAVLGVGRGGAVLRLVGQAVAVVVDEVVRHLGGAAEDRAVEVVAVPLGAGGLAAVAVLVLLVAAEVHGE